MVISMAPGLSKVLVYEGSPNGTTATINDVLNRMATDNLAKQLSCSWGFDIDETTQQIFLQYAAQGQSFYIASGDSGAYSAAVTQPSDNPSITVVGGTTLTTTAAGDWQAESTWASTGGGRSTIYPLPDWQQGIDMSANHGSLTMRNAPDVAMLADNVFINADNGKTVTVSGTSIAAPLWAGFTALINEQAAAQGKPPVGFVNPALYRLGGSAGSSTYFHDITTGNNTTSHSPNLFYAVPGFDLCTGWGTPDGTNLAYPVNSQMCRQHPKPPGEKSARWELTG
jgi:subtilase family serine protease